MRDNVISE
jgi:hypothetical protein